MNGVRIPGNAIGRVGMVARLRRVAPESVGWLVAVRSPVGLVSHLGSPRPVFAWQVLVLGEPVALRGKACREIVVADACLEPVSDIAPEVIEDMVRLGLYRDLEEARSRARALFADNSLSEDALDAAVQQAAEKAQIEYALEQVPIGRALADLGFTRSDKGVSTQHWSGAHHGVELHVIAGPDMFGLYQLAGRCIKPGTAMWDERSLPPREARGKVAQTILEFWRAAFGRDAPVPVHLDLALLYEKHQADMRAVNVGLPTLEVDGEVLRAVRRWLARDFGPGPDEIGPAPDEALQLSYHDGLLRMAVGGRAYGCPAGGTWIGDCSVSLRTFLAVPPWLLRGVVVGLVQSLDSLSIHWFDMPLAAAPAGAGPADEPP
ncbi:MAG: hypothetical protein J0M00_06135 [Burkholderiales bacterium]|nr:hypothetical protein [Burkholderiales bacterium]